MTSAAKEMENLEKADRRRKGRRSTVKFDAAAEIAKDRDAARAAIRERVSAAEYERQKEPSNRFFFPELNHFVLYNTTTQRRHRLHLTMNS